MQVAYTGCNPRGLMLARGKDLSKTLVHYRRIAVPAFAVFPMHRKVKRPARLALPLIVKSLSEDASYGISQASVVDTDDKAVVIGTVGEIVVRGDNVMMGYWERPEETARAVIDGWMHTGDGGYMDEHGFVFVVDRVKDMIISGGENVYSVEVENAVAQHPAVAQCAVVGIPDERWGEQVHAVVVLKNGAQVDPLRFIGEDR